MDRRMEREGFSPRPNSANKQNAALHRVRSHEKEHKSQGRTPCLSLYALGRCDAAPGMCPYSHEPFHDEAHIFEFIKHNEHVLTDVYKSHRETGLGYYFIKFLMMMRETKPKEFHALNVPLPMMLPPYIQPIMLPVAMGPLSHHGSEQKRKDQDSWQASATSARSEEASMLIESLRPTPLLHGLNNGLLGHLNNGPVTGEGKKLFSHDTIAPPPWGGKGLGHNHGSFAHQLSFQNKPVGSHKPFGGQSILGGHGGSTTLIDELRPQIPPLPVHSINQIGSQSGLNNLGYGHSQNRQSSQRANDPRLQQYQSSPINNKKPDTPLLALFNKGNSHSMPEDQARMEARKKQLLEVKIDKLRSLVNKDCSLRS